MGGPVKDSHGRHDEKLLIAMHVSTTHNDGYDTRMCADAQSAVLQPFSWLNSVKHMLLLSTVFRDSVARERFTVDSDMK